MPCFCCCVVVVVAAKFAAADHVPASVGPAGAVGRAAANPTTTTKETQDTSSPDPSRAADCSSSTLAHTSAVAVIADPVGIEAAVVAQTTTPAMLGTANEETVAKPSCGWNPNPSSLSPAGIVIAAIDMLIFMPMPRPIGMASGTDIDDMACCWAGTSPVVVGVGRPEGDDAPRLKCLTSRKRLHEMVMLMLVLVLMIMMVLIPNLRPGPAAAARDRDRNLDEGAKKVRSGHGYRRENNRIIAGGVCATAALIRQQRSRMGISPATGLIGGLEGGDVCALVDAVPLPLPPALVLAFGPALLGLHYMDRVVGAQTGTAFSKALVVIICPVLLLRVIKMIFEYVWNGENGYRRRDWGGGNIEEKQNTKIKGNVDKDSEL
ncbi:hypothetical protein BDZ97DRAFT_2060370 [Flammula alnicola]|nr:hypothetical protein BDZ97DRAFT_2060370 [Flammula alnicola]